MVEVADSGGDETASTTVAPQGDLDVMGASEKPLTPLPMAEFQENKVTEWGGDVFEERGKYARFQHLENQVFGIPVDLIDRNPDQPRLYFTAPAKQRLSSTVGAVGQLQPIQVVPYLTAEGTFRFALIDGERRWRNAKEKGQTHIKGLIDWTPNNNVLFLKSFAANLGRENHNPIEHAIAVRRCMDIVEEEFGIPVTELSKNKRKVSELTGFSMYKINKYLKFLDLDPEVRDLLALDKILESHTVQIAGVHRVVVSERLKNFGVKKFEDLPADQQITQADLAFKVLGIDDPEQIPDLPKAGKGVISRPRLKAAAKELQGKTEMTPESVLAEQIAEQIVRTVNRMKKNFGAFTNATPELQALVLDNLSARSGYPLSLLLDNIEDGDESFRETTTRIKERYDFPPLPEIPGKTDFKGYIEEWRNDAFNLSRSDTRYRMAVALAKASDEGGKAYTAQSLAEELGVTQTTIQSNWARLEEELEPIGIKLQRIERKERYQSSGDMGRRTYYRLMWEEQAEILAKETGEDGLETLPTLKLSNKEILVAYAEILLEESLLESADGNSFDALGLAEILRTQGPGTRFRKGDFMQALWKKSDDQNPPRNATYLSRGGAWFDAMETAFPGIIQDNGMMTRGRLYWVDPAQAGLLRLVDPMQAIIRAMRKKDAHLQRGLDKWVLPESVQILGEDIDLDRTRLLELLGGADVIPGTMGIDDDEEEEAAAADGSPVEVIEAVMEEAVAEPEPAPTVEPEPAVELDVTPDEEELSPASAVVETVPAASDAGLTPIPEEPPAEPVAAAEPTVEPEQPVAEPEPTPEPVAAPDHLAVDIGEKPNNPDALQVTLDKLKVAPVHAPATEAPAEVVQAAPPEAVPIAFEAAPEEEEEEEDLTEKAADILALMLRDLDEHGESFTKRSLQFAYDQLQNLISRMDAEDADDLIDDWSLNAPEDMLKVTAEGQRYIIGCDTNQASSLFLRTEKEMEAAAAEACVSEARKSLAFLVGSQTRPISSIFTVVDDLNDILTELEDDQRAALIAESGMPTEGFWVKYDDLKTRHLVTFDVEAGKFSVLTEQEYLAAQAAELRREQVQTGVEIYGVLAGGEKLPVTAFKEQMARLNALLGEMDADAQRAWQSAAKAPNQQALDLPGEGETLEKHRLDFDGRAFQFVLTSLAEEQRRKQQAKIDQAKTVFQRLAEHLITEREPQADYYQRRILDPLNAALRTIPQDEWPALFEEAGVPTDSFRVDLQEDEYEVTVDLENGTLTMVSVSELDIQKSLMAANGALAKLSPQSGRIDLVTYMEFEEALKTALSGLSKKHRDKWAETAGFSTPKKVVVVDEQTEQAYLMFYDAGQHTFGMVPEPDYVEPYPVVDFLEAAFDSYCVRAGFHSVEKLTLKRLMDAGEQGIVSDISNRATLRGLAKKNSRIQVDGPSYRISPDFKAQFSPWKFEQGDTLAQDANHAINKFPGRLLRISPAALRANPELMELMHRPVKFATEIFTKPADYRLPVRTGKNDRRPETHQTYDGKLTAAFSYPDARALQKDFFLFAVASANGRCEFRKIKGLTEADFIPWPSK